MSDAHPPSPSPPDPRVAVPARPPLVVRVGEACVFGVGVAALSSVPTALRATTHGAGFLDGLLVGTAALLPVVTLSIVMLRAAGRGLRGIVGQQPSRALALRIALWIGLALPALALLATMLKVATNHRGLGGATFGVFGLALVAGAALLAFRVVGWGESLASRGVKPWILAAAGAAIGVLPVVVVAAPLGRSGTTAEGGAGVVAAIIDGALATVAMALVASVRLGDRAAHWAGRYGVPFSALLLIVATARLEASPRVGRAVQQGGGLAATLLRGLEQWTDRDGDGHGAHFGGLDCDEGDPARHGLATEIQGDGVDQDCDGADSLAAQPAAASSAGSAAPAASSSGGAPAAAPGPKPVPASKQPDIVLLTLDSVRADRTSAYGYDKPTTPKLAELAGRAVVLDRAYAAASDTQRAYVPLVTGKRLHLSARDKREWPTLLSDNDTLAERLKRAGYATAAVSSFTWVSEDRGFGQGFDRFEPAYKEAHPERGVTGPHAVRAARKILEDLADRDKPIFLWVHLFDAHEKFMEHRGISFGKGRGAAYDGEIAFVDQQIGLILEAIAASPRAGRTAIVVHGTNGEGLDEHGFTGHAGELYDEAIRVPWIVAAPGLAPARVAAPVSLVDLVPTLLDLGGAPKEGTEGASLLPALRGDAGAGKRAVFVRSKKGTALIDWPLKLMVTEKKKGSSSLLFDLAADPSEQNDLAGARAADVERLTELAASIDAPAN